MIVFFLILSIIPIIDTFGIERMIIPHLNIETFRESIQKELSAGHSPLSYKKAKQLLLKYDKMKIYDLNYNNLDFNLNSILIKDNYISNINIKEKWNIEHLYPQSKGTKKNPAKSDLYHLFVCNSMINSHRGNFKFTDSYSINSSDKVIYLDKRGHKIDNFNDDIYPKTAFLSCKSIDKKIFIPTPFNKGIISRSLAYMSIRYQLPLEEIISPPSLLIQWSNKYPPSQEEILRSLWISTHQGNHNLFILYPQLINYCFPQYLCPNNQINNFFTSSNHNEIDYNNLIDYFNLISKEEIDTCSIEKKRKK